MKTLISAALLVAVSVASPVAVTAERADRILFLDLKLIEGTAYLENTTIVPGRLKRPKTITYVEGELHFKVLSASGQTLFEGTFPDPTVLHVEYEDDQGQMHRETVVRDGVDFSIRVPYSKAVHRLILYRIDSVGHIGGEIETTVRQIGSLLIPLKEVEE